MGYKDLFFDLDHTLWDFDRNSRAALESLYDDYLDQLKADFEEFHESYVHVNDLYWAQYRVGHVRKEELRTGRFRDSLCKFGLEDEALVERLSTEYLKRSPYMTHLFPHALETLSYLKNRGYNLHIITNGFSEVQDIKLKESGLLPYFNTVLKSEEVGKRKPHPLIFEEALKRSLAQVEYSLMIGDNAEADIGGARNIGMDQVYFNPLQKGIEVDSTHEIHCLSELQSLL